MIRKVGNGILDSCFLKMKRNEKRDGIYKNVMGYGKLHDGDWRNMRI